jgi:hypothetical protein
MLSAFALGQDAAPTPILKFSAGKAGTHDSAPWEPVKINDRKTPTRYELVDDGGTVVLHAVADKAASLLGQQVMADVAATPWLRWRWKIEAPIASADNAVAQKEDSPARLVLEFEGDRAKLPCPSAPRASSASRLPASRSRTRHSCTSTPTGRRSAR